MHGGSPQLAIHLDDEGHRLLHLEAHLLPLCQAVKMPPNLPQHPVCLQQDERCAVVIRGGPATLQA